MEELNSRANVTHSAKEKLKFNDTIIEITDKKEFKINDLNNNNDDDDYNEKKQVNELGSQTNYDGEITESEYQNRDNDELEFLNEYEESLKKSIYRQATMINQSSIISPKFQRIHEGVSRVFGLDDPPPGFGLIYPKYYYLEQKRPQPMSPLKVWRGFNGNIYFEPIHLQNFNLNSNDASQTTTLNFNRKNLPDTNEPNQTTSVSKFIDLLDYKNNVNAGNNNIKAATDSNLKFHNTKDNTSILLEEASEILLANTLSKKTQTFFQVNDNETEIMSSNSLNLTLRKSNNKLNGFVTKRSDMMQREHSKLRINTENPNKIFPNLAAVKRNNVPIRGLAYKEVKQRIINTAESSMINDNNNNNNIVAEPKTLDPNGINYGIEYFYNYNNKNKATPEELFRYTNTTGNSGYLRSESPPRVNYREMRKSIRKGVTTSNFSSIIYNNQHQRLADEKKHSLNEIFTPKIISGLEKKSKALITHRNFKILNIKGDRIANLSNIDIIVPTKSVVNTNINNNIDNTSAINHTTTDLLTSPTTILTEKSKTDITPNRINKIVIKARFPKSPSSLSIKSNVSLVTIQPNNKRFQNTSPEVT